MVVAAAVVNVQGWAVLRIQPASGRRRAEAGCRSWAACPGRSASRKLPEEGGKRFQEQRRGGARIRGTVSCSRISRRRRPPSPRRLPSRLLRQFRSYITRSSGGSCAHCMRSTTSSRMGRPLVGTPCRRSTKGERAGLLKCTRNHVCLAKVFILLELFYLSPLGWMRYTHTRYHVIVR